MSTRIDDSANKPIFNPADKVPIGDGTIVPKHYTAGQIADNSSNTGVTPGSYSIANITVNAQGKITSASDGIVDGGAAT
jgi:hypothetical protein